MSVPKSKQKLSNMEFFRLAIAIRQYVTCLVLKDFGMKTKIRDLKYIANTTHMSDEDKAKFIELLTKYKMGGYAIDVYPEWLINKFRDWIIVELHNMISNIVKANTIYVTTVVEHNERRMAQNNVIIACENLLQILQYAIDCFNIDGNAYMKVTSMIIHEINVVKKWRKSDDDRFNKQLRNNEIIQYDKLNKEQPNIFIRRPTE